MAGVAVATGRRDDVDIERDRELVERAQSGDADAFGDLYLRYFDRLCRFCFRRLGSMSEAEDAAQEAFTRAWKALPRFDGERRLYPWLSVIAANVCTDIVRRRGRSKVVDEPDLERVAAAVDGGQEEIVDRSDADLLNAALGRISPRHREVLRLRESYEWSYQKIAAYQGVEVSTIETLLFRARRSLRREFMALAEAQGALAGVMILAVKRGIWRARHLGAPAGAAKSAVPAVAGAGAGAGGGGAVLTAGAVAALFVVGALAGSTMIGRSSPAQPVRAVHHPMTSRAATAAGSGSAAHPSQLAAAAAATRSSQVRSGRRPVQAGAGGRSGGATSATSVSQLTAGAASAQSGLGSAVSEAGPTLRQFGGAVGGVVRTAAGVVNAMLSTPKNVAPPATVPTTLPPVTLPTSTTLP